MNEPRPSGSATRTSAGMRTIVRDVNLPRVVISFASVVAHGSVVARGKGAGSTSNACEKLTTLSVGLAAAPRSGTVFGAS